VNVPGSGPTSEAAASVAVIVATGVGLSAMVTVAARPRAMCAARPHSSHATRRRSVRLPASGDRAALLRVAGNAAQGIPGLLTPHMVLQGGATIRGPREPSIACWADRADAAGRVYDKAPGQGADARARPAPTATSA
jgi:hypothetical protein